MPITSTSSTRPATDPPRLVALQILTWCRTPVEDPGRRSGPKVPDEKRNGIQAGTAGHAELERTIRLIKLQRPASSCNVPHPSHHIQRGATGRASRKPAAGSADATLLSLPPASSPGSSEHPLAENHSRRHRAQSQRSRKPTIKARSRFNPWVSAVRHSFPPSSIPTRKDIRARTAGHDGIAEKSDFSSNVPQYPLRTGCYEARAMLSGASRD